MRLRALGFAGLLAVIAASVYGLFIVPADLNQGDAQRIMYPHVGSALIAYLSFGVTALGGIGWLIRRDLRFDALALAAAEVGVLFTAFTIWAGMMWARPVWGTFWQWEDPRLTTTALLLALYVGYLLLRRLSDDPARRATRAAVVGLVAAVDIPIVHFSVIWWRGLHQTATFLDPNKILRPSAPLPFVLALVAMLLAFLLFWAWLVIRRYELARLHQLAEEQARTALVMRARKSAQPMVAPATSVEGGSVSREPEIAR
jgi:heme exporter protein C